MPAAGSICCLLFEITTQVFLGQVSATDLYFTAPLALLHSGTSPLDALTRCLSCGVVNAGFGYRGAHGEDAFQQKLAEAIVQAEARGEDDPLPVDAWGETPAYLEEALVGAPIVGVQGGSRADDAETYGQHRKSGGVFFRIRADWMWNALHTASDAEGADDSPTHKLLTWREFRILAAILSSKVNTYGFTFLGWESIQARACGFHSKTLFQAGNDTLPEHCQPLSRHDIRRGLDRLEVLRFFARCRYATGTRGGLMAYSFRHPDRQNLVQDIQKWAAANQAFKTKVTDLRASDVAAFTAPEVKATPTPTPAPKPSPMPAPKPQVQSPSPAKDISPLLASIFSSPRASSP